MNSNLSVSKTCHFTFSRSYTQELIRSPDISIVAHQIWSAIAGDIIYRLVLRLPKRAILFKKPILVCLMRGV